jgi:hypothetical protein
MLFRIVFALLVVSATAFTASKPTLVRPVSLIRFQPVAMAS